MAESTCEIPPTFVDDFNATSFSNTRAIVWMHERTPRWGHSRNLLSLMTGTEDEQKDYVKGILASSIAVFCFFLLWLICILSFKSLGPDNIGWLSGMPRSLPTKPGIDDTQALKAWENQFSRSSKRLRMLRMCVGFACFSIIVSSILMSIKGVDSLSRSLGDGRDAIAIVQNLTQGGVDLIEHIMEQNLKTGEQVDRLLEEINGICPALRDPICTDINDPSTCNFEGILENTDVITTTLQHFVAGDRSVYYKEMEGARDTLVEFLSVTEDLDDRAQTFNWVLYSAMVFSLMLGSLCLFMMVGLACRVSKVLTCMRLYFFLPMFSVLVVLSFCFSVAFILASMPLADLCIDANNINVDYRIQVILNRFRQTLSPILVEIVSFYISQCPAERIPEDIANQLQFVSQAIPTLGDFSSLVESNLNRLQNLCGFDDPSSLIDVASTANVQLCEIAELLREIRMFFQCTNWYPLYETSVYGAICYNGTDGFAWIATTQFVVVFMATIILMMRAAFFDVQVDDEENGKITKKPTKITPLETPRTVATFESDTPTQASAPPRVTASLDGFELSYDDAATARSSF